MANEGKGEGKGGGGRGMEEEGERKRGETIEREERKGLEKVMVRGFRKGGEVTRGKLKGVREEIE